MTRVKIDFLSPCAMIWEYIIAFVAVQPESGRVLNGGWHDRDMGRQAPVSKVRISQPEIITLHFYFTGLESGQICTRHIMPARLKKQPQMIADSNKT